MKANSTPKTDQPPAVVDTSPTSSAVSGDADCSPFPDKVGRWLAKVKRVNGCDERLFGGVDKRYWTDDEYVFDVYELPNGVLCAWCDECDRYGMSGESEVWADDEWLGHIPTQYLAGGGEFFFLENEVSTPNPVASERRN